MKLPRRHGLTIEKYALLTENAPELGAELDEWHGFYRGASPGERTLLDMAVMASVHLRRILACLTETVNQQVRTAIFHFDCEQEDEIQRFRDMLESRPGVAVVGLKRSALGCRFLILRWERLLRLLESDGTLYGKDRDEAIHYQGARATDPANLFESEGAYLTWIYCLMAQPDPRDEDFVEIGNKSWMPMGLNDRKIHHWLGDDALSRKLLKEIAERELAALRPREERLRKNYEEPGAMASRSASSSSRARWGPGWCARWSSTIASSTAPMVPSSRGATRARRPAGCRVDPTRSCTARETIPRRPLR